MKQPYLSSHGKIIIIIILPNYLMQCALLHGRSQIDDDDTFVPIAGSSCPLITARESELPARTMNTGMPSLAMSTAVCGGRRGGKGGRQQVEDEKKEK